MAIRIAARSIASPASPRRGWTPVSSSRTGGGGVARRSRRNTGVLRRPRSGVPGVAANRRRAETGRPGVDHLAAVSLVERPRRARRRTQHHPPARPVGGRRPLGAGSEHPARPRGRLRDAQRGRQGRRVGNRRRRRRLRGRRARRRGHRPAGLRPSDRYRRRTWSCTSGSRRSSTPTSSTDFEAEVGALGDALEDAGTRRAVIANGDGVELPSPAAGE